MNELNPAINHVTDTALWVACFRARETKRTDALFQDPFAERLAGPRGFQIADTLVDGSKHDWAWAARTYLFDKFILGEIADGADLVLVLGAGLDARPYRMPLPPTLRWVEVDHPAIVSYKENILATDQPACRLERVSLDLADPVGRRKLFSSLNSQAQKIVVVCEGLLIYFEAAAVESLAADLASSGHVTSWLVDLASPGQLRLMQKTTGKQLGQAGAAFLFGPSAGPNFFLPFGWQPRDVQGLLRTASLFHRAPTELLSLLPEPKGPLGNYPWTGVCQLRRP